MYMKRIKLENSRKMVADKESKAFFFVLLVYVSKKEKPGRSGDGKRNILWGWSL